MVSRPAPRLIPRELRITCRLARTIRQGKFETRYNTSFAQVIRPPQTLRQHEEGTWITPEMQQAYIRLHELGHAQCMETCATDDSWEEFTEFAWAAASAANRCSTARPTPPRWPWRPWPRGCKPRVLTYRLPGEKRAPGPPGAAGNPPRQVSAFLEVGCAGPSTNRHGLKRSRSAWHSLPRGNRFPARNCLQSCRIFLGARF